MVNGAINLVGTGPRQPNVITSHTNEMTDLMINESGIELRFADRTAANYGFVMQMFGDEYFASHKYENIDKEKMMKLK